MQTFRELNLLPSGLSGGRSRGHDATPWRREAAGGKMRLHAEMWAVCRMIVRLSDTNTLMHVSVCTHTARMYSCGLKDCEEQSRLYPRLWQESLPQDMDQFCLTSNTASPWFLPCPVPSSLALSVCLLFALQATHLPLSSKERCSTN